ncbi:CoA pyrophosphatase [Stakelama sp. CBK3Z-3]|uniref:CoA pyrophosphatase n=1 Tax=Stakelama flava TaxID=2860338 RepID=A0ABS6XL00_9SPHN|nr:CoA pyrophosphatase [Stakelama flava]MBW4330493.1 CoA pyrophosphatase [Stakelama flava]
MSLFERLSEALGDASPDHVVLLTGDDGDAMLGGDTTLIDAAVLVAVTDRPHPGVILTQRTRHLRNHAGQIAFPGGRKDDSDTDLVAAALREAHEEIALPADQVRIVGLADRYRTITGFQVTPVVGVIPPDLRFRAEPGEVDDVFEVPLDFLLDATNHLEAEVEWQGRNRHYYEIFWDERRIWGATAAMIVNLSRRLSWTP